MVAWKASLKPLEIAQVSSYLLQFQGTTPANPKDPEGEIWVDENAEESSSDIEESTQEESTSDDTAETMETTTVASNN